MKVTIPERCSNDPECKFLAPAIRSRSGPLRRAVISSAALLGLFACAGSSSSSQPTNNLTAVGLTIDSAQPRIGFALDVTTSIEALEVTEDVSVAFFAFNGEDIADELEEVRQFYLGTVTIPLVEPSTLAYSALLMVPSSITPAGDYVIMCSVDSGDLIAELDEDDNEAEVPTTLQALEDPNLYLHDFVLDFSSILLDPDQDDVAAPLGDVQNSDAGATLVLGLEGTLAPIEVEAFVHLRLTRSDLSQGNTLDVPLYLWDSTESRYVDVYGLFGPVEWLPVGAIAPQDVLETAGDVEFSSTQLRLVHLDAYCPGGLAAMTIAALDGNLPGAPPLVPPPDVSIEVMGELHDFLSGAEPGDFSFEVVAEVRAVDPLIGDRDPVDNSALRPLYVLVPGNESQSPDYPLAFEAGQEARWENDRFGVGFEFDSFASVDGRGARAQVQGAVPTTLFGHDFDFMWFDAHGQVTPAIDPSAIPQGEVSGFSLQLDFAAITVYSFEEDLGFQFDGTFSVTKEKEYTRQFFVGPVPVTATGTIYGEIGYGLNAELVSDSLMSATGPYATLGARIEATAGVPGFQASAVGDVVLVDERFIGTVTTELYVTEFGPDPARYEGIANMTVTNTVTGPSGDLYLLAEYPGVKWCRRCGFFRCYSYPCGLKTIRRRFALVSWQSFVKEDILFEETLCKGVVIDDGQVSFAVCD